MASNRQPPRDRTGPKPLPRPRSLFPEVRVTGSGEVCMTIGAFSALPVRNVERMLAEQEGRKQARLREREEELKMRRHLENPWK